MAEQEDAVFEVGPKKKATRVLKPSPALGIAAGVGVAVVGVLLWMLMVKKYTAPWMAIVIAVGAAFAIRFLARSKAVWYGMIGGVLALLSALAGHLVTANSVAAKQGWKSVGELLQANDIATVFTLLGAVTRPVDVLLYIGAVALGFWMAFEHPKPVAPE